MEQSSDTTLRPPGLPSFNEALYFWWKLGWISFGGPAGQIAIMQHELVEKKRWIEADQFLLGLNFCLLLPGPEAQQLATYLGWRLHGMRGAVAAGTLFLLPSAFILWSLSLLYVSCGRVHAVEAAFAGIVPAVLAIIFRALFRLAARTLTTKFRWWVAVAASLFISAFPGYFPLVIVGAALVGLLSSPEERTTQKEGRPLLSQLKSFLGKLPIFPAVGIGLFIWLLPVLAAVVALGANHTVTREGLFFSKAAVVTFGGAYAVLPYVAEQAVQNNHWLDSDQMLYGYGLAESTPGPLLMVFQFIGFLGAWNQPGQLTPLLSATLGAAMTTWVTFVPSFLFILVGGPMLEQVVKRQGLAVALTTISSAVVGVMAHFAVWFTWNTLLGKGQVAAGQVNFLILLMSLAAFLALERTKIGVIPLIAFCAILNVIYTTLAPRF